MKFGEFAYLYLDSKFYTLGCPWTTMNVQYIVYDMGWISFDITRILHALLVIM